MNFTDELAHIPLPPALRAAILAQAATVIEQAQQIQQQATLIHNKEQKIQAITLELAHLRRMRYGVKSETLSTEQRDLFDETCAADMAALEARLAEAQAAIPLAVKKPRTQAGRQALPPHLTRVVQRHEPESCTCGQCGQNLVKIGEDISEQLDVEPARFFVIQHIRPQYACRACETVSAAPIAPAIIDGGLAAPGLLAWVMVSKYVDHLPLYRLNQIAARSGVPLATSTLASWVGTTGWWLQLLADRLIERLLQAGVLHADETPVQQLDPGQGKTKRGYLWGYRSNDLDGSPRIIVFDYQSGRSGEHARNFLGDWQGRLMVDDYSGYKALFRAGVTELGCWAHARRKFYELHVANQSPIAAEALKRIGALYALEAQANAAEPADRQALRQKLRQTKAQPQLRELKDWLTQTLRVTAPNSGTAKAISYSLRRWEGLARYAEDGISPIDNNPLENCIRPIAIGKKNWLFAGSEKAGQRAAAIQTLLGTAKLNGLDPLAWLKDTLEKLPTWPNSRIDELLPLRPLAQV